MNRAVSYVFRTGILVGAFACVSICLLAGCAYPANYQEWQWKQWNPNYVPLPGEPNR